MIGATQPTEAVDNGWTSPYLSLRLRPTPLSKKKRRMIDGHGDDDGSGDDGGSGDDHHDNDVSNSPLVEEPGFTVIWNWHSESWNNFEIR